MTQAIRIRPAGDGALVVEFEERIDPEISARVLDLDRAVLEARLPGVLETLPTYRTLLVRFDPLASDVEAIAAHVADLAAKARGDARLGRIWRIPVAYGGAHGEDLEAVAAAKQMTPAEVIALHSAVVYHCYMLGFMPGYAYLGGLDPRLHFSRRINPRLRVPAGTIAIGGQQAAVQSIEAPSGWHLLGRTPERLFDMRREQPFLIQPGERVQFVAISATEFDELDARAEKGEIVAEVEA